MDRRPDRAVPETRRRDGQDVPPGSILVVGAVFARAGLVNTNAERAEVGLPPLRTLAEAYPRQPTWLVPEGPIGFGISGVLVILGMGLTVLAEKAAKR